MPEPSLDVLSPSKGRLWIPGFSSNVISRFDPQTREFETWPLPVGSETPYALHVDRTTDTVWICGTNSDTLIRFQPETEAFLVYPLPTRVTYTREIDFDADGRTGSDEDLFLVIRDGAGPSGGNPLMAAWGHLGDEQVRVLVAYVRSLEGAKADQPRFLFVA